MKNVKLTKIVKDSNKEKLKIEFLIKALLNLTKDDNELTINDQIKQSEFKKHVLKFFESKKHSIPLNISRTVSGTNTDSIEPISFLQSELDHFYKNIMPRILKNELTNWEKENMNDGTVIYDFYFKNDDIKLLSFRAEEMNENLESFLQVMIN